MTVCSLCSKDIKIFDDSYVVLNFEEHINKIKKQKLENPYVIYGNRAYICWKCYVKKFLKEKKKNENK